MKNMRLVTAVVTLAFTLPCALGKEEWRVASTGVQTMVIDMGLSGTGTEVVYAAALENGAGSMNLRSTDLGVTWNTTLYGRELMMLGCSSANPLSAIALGALGEVQFTVDGGKKWNEGVAVVPTSQNVEVSRDRKLYGATGGKGVSISKDFGATFDHYHVTPEKNDTVIIPTRYGAFPSDKTWFLTAGTFPAPAPSLAPDTADVHLSSRYTVSHKKGQEPKYTIKFPEEKNSRRRLQQDPGYIARIWHTADGGKTWDLQLHSEGAFYMNGINCCSDTVCYAVAEGFADDNSADPGSRILKTTDGGKTWKHVFKGSATQSLMAARCVGDGSEAWVAGGNMVRPGFEGEWYHTTDGGANWSKDYSNAGGSVLAMEFDGRGGRNGGRLGMASALTLESGGIIFSYKDWL